MKLPSQSIKEDNKQFQKVKEFNKANTSFSDMSLVITRKEGVIDYQDIIDYQYK